MNYKKSLVLFWARFEFKLQVSDSGYTSCMCRQAGSSFKWKNLIFLLADIQTF